MSTEWCKIMAMMLLVIGTSSPELRAGSTGSRDGSLRGTVTEAGTGEPIPGATVLIEETGRGVATSADGEFEFSDMPAGTYTMTVSSVGFSSQTVTVDHPYGEVLSIRLTLSVFEQEDVIVTSSPLGRSIQYQPAEAINAESLQRKAAPSLGEVLDGIPGVTTRSFGSAPARPVIRGFDGDRVLVMQNGERMGDLSSTAVDHAVAIDPLSMDRVEVVRGPASLLYGSSAIGGVVNMFSNDMPREWEAGTDGTVASHAATVNDMGAGLVRLQHATSKLAAAGRLIYRSGGNLRTPEGRLPDTAIDNFSYGGGTGYRAGSFETGVSLTGMDYTYGLPEAIDIPGESIEIRMDRFNVQSISTLKTDRFFEHAELRIHYSDYRHDEITMINSPEGRRDEQVDITFDQQTLSSSLVLQHRPIGTMEGAAGFSFNYSDIAVGGVDALTPDAGGYFLAGYLYEEIGLGDHLSFKAGARMELKETVVKINELFPDPDDFKDRSDIILSGAAGLNYSPSSNWTTGFQIARAYRTPTVEELYSHAAHAAAGSFDIGDPTLNNEFSLGTDLFIEHSSDRFDGQLSLFANRISHFVDFSPTGETHELSGLPVFRYLSKNAVLYGFEFSAAAGMSSLLSAGLGFDYVRGRERTGDRNNLTFIPAFRTSLSVTADDGSFWMGSRLVIVNSQEKVAPNEDPTGGYLLTGVDAGYRFSNEITASFRVDNLFNVKYRNHLSRVENRNAPMPGRNLNAMLRWNF
ncbi:MAG: TonB-dependent receptor [Balneolaceae bacterium]